MVFLLLPLILPLPCLGPPTSCSLPQCWLTGGELPGGLLAPSPIATPINHAELLERNFRHCSSATKLGLKWQTSAWTVALWTAGGGRPDATAKLHPTSQFVPQSSTPGKRRGKKPFPGYAGLLCEGNASQWGEQDVNSTPTCTQKWSIPGAIQPNRLAPSSTVWGGQLQSSQQEARLGGLHSYSCICRCLLWGGCSHGGPRHRQISGGSLHLQEIWITH